MKIFNKRIIWLAALIIIAILAAYLFYAPAAGAAPKSVKSGAAGAAGQVGVGIASGLTNVVTWGVIVLGILYIINATLSYLIYWAGVVLDIAFNFAVNPQWFYSEPVVAGWTLMRDFANIWFVLVILFIAIAIILKIESYQAKKTLSWVIVVALLINFSLPLVRVVIDFANIIAFQFLPQIGNSKSVAGYGQIYAVSEKVSASLRLPNLSSALSPDEYKKLGGAIGLPPPESKSSQNSLVPTAHALEPISIVAGILWGIGVTIGSVASLYVIDFVSSKLFGSESAVLGGATTAVVVTLALNIILLFMALYVMAALAILTVIRTVVLMLLTVLAPAGFILTILPGTSSYATQWWTALLKQAFFLPAVAFLLWVALSLGAGLNSALNFQGGSLSTLPANPALLFFFVLNIILLYGCLKVAQSMGTVGADTAISWFGKAKGWVTGAVGGVALRNAVGRLGGLMQQAPAIQHSVFGKRISQMMTKAGARLPGGSYEELQKERAAMAMQQGESRWADEFLKAGTPGRLAMLNAMSDQQKNDLRERLKTLSSTGAQAFDNAMRLHFGEAALGKVDLEGWKRSDKDAQKNLAPYSPEVTEQILRSFPDDDARAKWMAGLTPENRSKAMGAMNARFSTAEMNKYGKAEKRQEMRGKELTGGDEFDKFVNDLPSDKDSDYIEAADNHQLLSWLESVTKIGGQAQRAEKLRKYQSVMKNRLGTVEEQDNFNKNVFRRASMPAISSYINTLPDVASKEKVIGSASSTQQAQLWVSDKTIRNTVDTAVGKQSADTQKDFHSALAREVERKTAGEIADVFVELPKETKRIVVQGNIDRNVEVITNLDRAGKSADAKEFADNLKDAGLTTQYVRKLNHVHKVQYIDGVDPARSDFVDKVGNEIRNTSARELTAKLNADILANKQLRAALLKAANATQLATLSADTPAKQAIIKEILTTDDKGDALDPKNILNEIKAKNKELGEQIEALREKQEQTLMPIVRQFLESILGPK